MSEFRRHPFSNHPLEVAARESLAEAPKKTAEGVSSSTDEVLPPHLRQGPTFSAEAKRQKLLDGEIPFYDHGPTGHDQQVPLITDHHGPVGADLVKAIAESRRRRLEGVVIPRRQHNYSGDAVWQDLPLPVDKS